MLVSSPHIPPRSASRTRAHLLLLPLLLALAGCGRLHTLSTQEYVYVTARQMYLRDRVAVVANRTGEVTNGERLTVLEHGRRFVRVKTPQGATGWIEDHAVLDQGVYDQFQALAQQHAGDRPVATAVLYNELYIHISPGRKTLKFYIFPTNTKVSLLERASVSKSAPATLAGLPAPAKPSAPADNKPAPPRPGKHQRTPRKESFESRFASPVPMEDWWLVRDAQGRTGWMLSRDLEVDVPQDVAQYAENEKMVGAYVLRTVDDPDSGRPNGQVPEYLTVLTPYKQGLPYDFDQVRVFTWDTHRHRYGTAFRLRDLAGFFPVNVTGSGGPTATPAFAFQVAQDNAVSLDPVTGRAHADHLVRMNYRLEGNLVRRVESAGEANASPAKRTAAAPIHAHRRKHHRSER